MMITGFAWYDREQWQRLAEVAADKEELDASFEEWQRNAEQAFRDLERSGVDVEKVFIDVDELAAWCKDRGVALDSDARALYVNFLLRERDADAGLIDDPHLDVCQNIEAGLKAAYQRHADLTDSLCIFALENAKIAVKKRHGFARNEKVTEHPLAKEIIDWCISIGEQRIGKINNLTLKEYIARIEKIRRSVKLHSDWGSRGYYEFIREFV